MQHKNISRQLAEGWLKEQNALHNQQLQQSAFGVHFDLTNTKFYLKTLSGLVICGELIVNNAQLKELNRIKIVTLRQRINEVSARVEAFKGLINGLQKPFNARQ